MPAQDKKPGDDRAAAEARAAKAQKAVDAANEELTDARSQVTALKTRNIGQFVVEVAPDAHIVHEGKSYHGADYPLEHGKDHGRQLVLDGPSAMQLAMSGHARIVRSA